MTATYLASTLNLSWKVIKSYGIDPTDVFQAAHIDPEKVECVGCRVNYRSVDRLWELKTRLIKDPCLGLRMADHWHPSYLNALGYSWLASSTIMEAFNRLVRYIHIVTETIELELHQREEELDLIVKYSSRHNALPQRCDTKLAVFMTMCRANFGDDLKPVRVSFRHAPPSCASQFHEFFKSPVLFDQPHNSLTLHLKDVTQKLTGANPYLAEINDNVVIDYLSHLRKRDIIQRTKAIIVESLSSGKLSNAMVARKLFMSVRSFQSALKKEGATYRDILVETRRDLAEGYINDSSIELQEVAYLLGFTEYSAFSRAFKKWAGKSPAEARAQLPIVDMD